jgi:hypothetical protein
MAFTKIHFNSGLQHGQLLRSTLTSLENGHDGLNDIMAALALMIDGDGSNATHFEEVMTRMGTTSTVNAKALYEELASLRFKLNTDSSVTDVLAALNQAFAKFR